MDMTKRLKVTALMVLTSAVLVSCDAIVGTEEEESQGVEKPSITIAHQNWADAVAIVNLTKVILEDNGFEVTLSEKDNAGTWAAVADASADAMQSAWLPSTHSSYYGSSGQYTDQVEDADINYENAVTGLIVPSYVTVDSLAGLAGASTTFDSEIQGIDPGAGLMSTTQTMIDDDTYSLSGWNLIDGSGSAMTTALENAITNNDAIVVTSWRPHWMFGEWDLKVLDDPQEIYGETENIHNIVRLGLEEDNPGAYQFFTQFDYTQINIEDVMADINDGTAPASAARTFVDANQSTINALLPDTAYFE
jgi:glycine betaine/proline transport system substrate-binding protein